MMGRLSGKVALVTGASRGIGRGIALQLAEAGATVYITGRQPEKSDGNATTELPTLEKTAEEVRQRGGGGGKCVAVYCDHCSADEVSHLFEKLEQEENGRLDILVNNVFSAASSMAGKMGKKFHELPPLYWDEVNNAGLRNHYICSVHAGKMMAKADGGLIVMVSSAGGLRYLFNCAYGVGKAAVDRMAADMAEEGRSDNIAVVSLWPGAVKTEIAIKAMEQPSKYDNFQGLTAEQVKKIFLDGETPEFAGRAVVELAADTNVMRKSGRVVIAADAADEYGFVDVDGRQPKSMRSAKTLLEFVQWNRTASFVPRALKLPGWLIRAATSTL